MTKSALCALTAALLTLPAWQVRADEIPANTVRIGIYSVFYHASADDISGPYVPPGVNLNVKNVETLYLAYLRRLSTHFTAELTLGWPPLTKTYGKGPAALGSAPYNGQEISSARWFAPNALIEYVFFDDSHVLRPYVGIGVNYTALYDRDSTAAGNAASGGPTRLELPASVGPVATVGLNYQLPNHWSAAISYSASRVDSRLTAITAGVVRTTHISFGPQTLVVAVGYSF
jgi:outer membrane protein